MDNILCKTLELPQFLPAVWVWQLAAGGGEGSRTPVRKPLDTTFSGCRVSFTLFDARAGTQARSSSNRFLRDRFNGKPPMHVHHFHDVQSRFVVLPRGTGDPQVTALPIIEPRGVNN